MIIRRMKNGLSLLCALTLMLALQAMAAPAQRFSFAGGTGDREDPYQIETVEQLQAIGENLSASYVLIADIDAGSVEAWQPIGTLVPIDEEGETPNPEYAFTGTFDGGGHVISNLNAVGTDMLGGLFGVVADAEISNVTFENLEVEGTVMVGAIGYAYHSTIDNVNVCKAEVRGIDGTATLESPANMLAALVGASMDSTYVNCDISDATVTVEGNPNAEAVFYSAHDCGILGGGFEGCSMSDCTVSDSSIAVNGDYCFGIGGMNGCLMTGDYYRNCEISNVSVTVGNWADLTGGAVGYTGNMNGAVTDVANVMTAGVTVRVGDNSYRVGGLIGGSFYYDAFAEYIPTPTVFSLTNCATDGAVEAGENSTAVGAVIGYAYQLESKNVTTTMEIMPIGQE